MFDLSGLKCAIFPENNFFCFRKNFLAYIIRLKLQQKLCKVNIDKIYKIYKMHKEYSIFISFRIYHFRLYYHLTAFFMNDHVVSVARLFR